jgi:hypothetical protein
VRVRVICKRCILGAPAADEREKLSKKRKAVLTASNSFEFGIGEFAALTLLHSSLHYTLLV